MLQGASGVSSGVPLSLYTVRFGGSGVRSISEFDATDPASMSHVRSSASYVTELSDARRIRIDPANEVAYVCGNSFSSFDISSGSITLKDTLSGIRAYDCALDLDNNYAYVTTFSSSNTVKIIDISDPDDMSVVSTLTHSDINNMREIVFNKSTGYLFACSYGVDKIVSISRSGTTLSVAGSVAVNNPTSIVLNLSGATKYAYIGGSGTDSFKVVNITNPSSMTVVDSYTAYGEAVDCDPANDIAVEDHFDGYYVFDVSTPSSISLLDSDSSSVFYDNPREVIIDPSTSVLYVFGEHDSMITSVDISTPSSTSRISSFTDTTNISDFSGACPLSGDGSVTFEKTTHAYSNP